MGWVLPALEESPPTLGVGVNTELFPGEDPRLCKHRDHISHLHVEENEVLWLVLGPGGGGMRAHGPFAPWL